MEEERIESLNSSQTSSHNHYAKWTVVIFVNILIASTFGALFGFMAGGMSRDFFPKVFQSIKNGNNVKESREIIKQRVIEEDSAVIDVVEKSSPAVVSIVISKDVPKIQDFFSDPFDFPGFMNPFGNKSNGDKGGVEKKKIGGGSGFIVTSDGMIITNKHVAEDASADYTVITQDGKEYSAKVLAKDPVNDIAVVKIDGSDFPTLNLGDSNSMKIGQTVIAIGNSLGEFSNTVSKGIISGLKRNITASGSLGESENLKNIIQTDAAINPGNSGGPLLNISGEVIGVNVAVAQGAENIGFAIPSVQVKKIIDQVKTTGKVSFPYIGVRYILIDKTIQKENNLSYDYGALIQRGTKITDFAVIPGSPADKAGIVENDIILEINGEKIDENNGLGDIVSKYSVGEEVTMKVWHKGDIKNVKVKLEERK